MNTVLIPKDNERDLTEIPDNIKRGLTIISVTNVEEVLMNALAGELTPIEWDEKSELESANLVAAASDDDDVNGVVTH